MRAGIIAQLAQAGKHILLEKPVGRTTAEAEEVVNICEAAGVTLGALFQHRVRAPSLAAADLIAGAAAEDDLGALGLVEIHVPLWRD